MKAFNVIWKVVAAIVAIAGIIYVVATYGNRIVAWAKRLLNKTESQFCDEDCDCCDDCDFDDDIEYQEIECPNCHDVICIDEDCFEDDDEIVCPNCNEVIEINFDVEEDE